jgi:CPA2 family monovalent cation:H+ antiporter-2
MELGAFLAGLAVGRSDFAARAASDAVPMRDAFAVLFFVSIGMLFDPYSIIKYPLIIGIVLMVVVIGKPLLAILTVRILGQPISTAIPIGAAFSQIGEFSFILGSVARSIGLINDTGWNALIAASIISIALNPSIYRYARRLSSKSFKTVSIPKGLDPKKDSRRCILVGYGPVGRIVYRLLSDQGSIITVIDLNLETVRRLRKDGHAAVYGDVLRAGTLDEAGIRSAGSLILCADIEDAAEIIRQARLLNPELRILARCANLRDAPFLRRAGANMVAAGEAEVGVALAEAVSASDNLDSDSAVKNRNAIRSQLYAST